MQQERGGLVDRDPHLLDVVEGQIQPGGDAGNDRAQDVNETGTGRHTDDDGAERLDQGIAYTSRAPEDGGSQVAPWHPDDRWVMTIELEIQTRSEGGWTVVAAGGELDLYTAPTLRDEVLATIERGDDRIAIDLNAVGFIDSTGLGILVACLKRVRERDGRLVLIAPETSPLRRLLSLTGLEQVLPTHTTLGDAVGA
jgi:anti-sigma B factor antagonist